MAKKNLTWDQALFSFPFVNNIPGPDLRLQKTRNVPLFMRHLPPQNIPPAGAVIFSRDTNNISHSLSDFLPIVSLSWGLLSVLLQSLNRRFCNFQPSHRSTTVFVLCHRRKRYDDDDLLDRTCFLYWNQFCLHGNPSSTLDYVIIFRFILPIWLSFCKLI